MYTVVTLIDHYVDFSRYDTDRNGYVDHQEFLARLGGEMKPGDTHGPSTMITEQSHQVMESMHRNQQVCLLSCFDKSFNQNQIGLRHSNDHEPIRTTLESNSAKLLPR